MKRASIVLVLAVVLMLPTAAIAESPEGPPPEATADGAHALVDLDGNRISDGLDAVLDSSEPSQRIDVIATFEDEAVAGRSAQSLPEEALNRRYTLISGFLASLNKGQIVALSRQPGIIRVDENFAVEATNNVTNEDFGTAAARVDYGVDGTGVGICIADTGYDPAHEQLDDPGKLAGWFDAIGGVGTPYDDHWHGTHVAGTAAGAGTGGPKAATYRGVAPGATVYATKVLASNGGAVADSVERGLEWCVVQPGVDIISMSLGTPVGSDGLDALSQAVNAAVGVGKIVVVAAGNSGDGPATVGAPGAAEHAITVGAVADWSGPVADPNHSNGVYLAPFSSRGPTRAPSSLTKPDIVGPGVTVTSAYTSGASDYATASGTSMAAPFAAGTVALMLHADPTLTTADVKALLATTAHDRGPTGKDNDWGWGLIDGYALVAEASGDASYNSTVFPPSTFITGSVESGGVWSHSFTLGVDDLDTPIAATVILDGTAVCALGFPDFCDLIGGWDWEPDLEAQLLDPNLTVLELSECPARGDCGSREPYVRATGHQETLHVMPTTPGDYTIQVFPEQIAGASGGSFTVELSAGSLGVVDTTPPVISLVGANPQIITVGGSYVELGASASDVPDGDISASIVIDASAVDTANTGTYQVLYDVSDAAGNPAVQVKRDVEVLPVVSVSASDGLEAGSVDGVFTVSRTGPTTDALSVAVDVTGSATAPPAAGADYTVAVPNPVVIPAGQTSLQVLVDPVDDAEDEGDETVALSIVADAAYVIGSPASATVTIVDDDAPPSVVGSSVGFDGGDVVDVGDVSGLAGDVSFEVWVRPDEFGVWRSPLGKAYGGEGAITQTSDGRLIFLHGTSGVNGGPYQAFFTSGSLVLGEWNHVVVTRDASLGVVTWYLNGVEDSRFVSSVTPVESSLPLLIGDGYAAKYVGGIDEVAVYGDVLSAVEVAEHYTSMAVGDDAAYGGVVSADLPVSYWRLDEAAGPVAADETTLNPGVYQGTPGYLDPGASVSIPPSVLGSSVGFDGGDVVDVGDVSGLAGDVSFEVWVRPDEFGVWRSPLGKAYGGEGAITQTSDGRLIFLHGTSGVNGGPYQAFFTSGSLVLGEWNHVVVTRDTSLGVVTWYLNGVEDSRFVSSVTPVESSLPLLIGDGYAAKYVGGIDEVAVYGDVLSAVEVAEHYTSMAVGDDAAYGGVVSADLPVSYWRLDEAAGPVAADETTLNPGVYQGTPGYLDPGASVSIPPSVLGSSVGFDGGDVVDVGDVSGLAGDVSFEVWVRPDEFGVWRSPLGKAYGGEGAITQTSDGRLIFLHGTSGVNGGPYQAFFTSGSLVLGEWNHVVVTRDTSLGVVTWYLNGVEDSRFVSSVTPVESSLPLLIGDGYAAKYVGGIDEVAVYGDVLSAVEVAEHYTSMAVGDDAAYGGVVSADLPVSYWRLDEAAGPVAADETTVNPGLYQGTPGYLDPGASVSIPPSVLGSSVGFDGGDVVDVGDVSGLAGDVSFEVWVRPDEFGVWRSPLGKAYGGEGAITQTSDGRLIFLHGTSGVNGGPYQAFFTSGSLVLGEWNHVVVTRDTSLGVVTWYLNGVEDSRFVSSVTPVESSLPLLIGDGYAAKYVGGIDEVAVYGDVLSAVEVAEHYTSMAVGDDAAYGGVVSADLPVSYWRLDEAGGAFAADETTVNPGVYQGTPGYLDPGASVP